MNVQREAIDAGIDSGLIRSLRALPGFRVTDPEDLRERVRNLVEPALDRAQVDRSWGRRGQFLYGELAAMAFAARLHYKEAPLSKDAASEAIGPLARFLNSWLHD